MTLTRLTRAIQCRISRRIGVPSRLSNLCDKRGALTLSIRKLISFAKQKRLRSSTLIPPTRFIAAASWDRRIHIFRDDPGLDQPPIAVCPGMKYPTHSDDIVTLIACAGNQFATSSCDGTLILWHRDSRTYSDHLYALMG